MNHSSIVFSTKFLKGCILAFGFKNGRDSEELHNGFIDYIILYMYAAVDV